MSKENEDLAARVARLEAWVEVVMRTLATLGLEALLIELDEARGVDYDEDGASPFAGVHAALISYHHFDK
jgi:hypothetical protein